MTDTPGTETPAPAPDPRDIELATLKAQVDALKANEGKFEELFDRVMATRPAAPDFTPTTPPELTFDDLPDPVEDKAAYAKALAAKLKAHDELTARAAAKAAEPQRILATLEADFIEAYPDLGQHTLLVRAAAGEVGAEFRRKGLDPVQLAQTNPDRLFRAIAKRAETELAKYRAPAAPEHRTGGTGGGSTPTSTTPVPEPARTSYLEEIRARQNKAGISRY